MCIDEDFTQIIDTIANSSHFSICIHCMVKNVYLGPAHSKTMGIYMELVGGK